MSHQYVRMDSLLGKLSNLVLGAVEDVVNSISVS